MTDNPCTRCKSTRILTAGGKVSDMFSAAIGDHHHQGYVPDDLGLGSGDYLEFSVCLDCGQLVGEWPLAPTALENPPPVDGDTITGKQIIELYSRHCECHPLDIMRTNHSHDCDTVITSACRTAHSSTSRRERQAARDRCAEFWNADQMPSVDKHCVDCGNLQFMTTSGITCPLGHGGAPSVEDQ